MLIEKHRRRLTTKTTERKQIFSLAMRNYTILPLRNVYNIILCCISIELQRSKFQRE